jgi:signal peptidase I
MMNKRTDEKTGMKSYVLYLIPAFVIIVILVLFRTVLLLGYVPSESMEPTLERDSYIIGTRLYRDIDVGDIIIFEREGTMMVKRVAACAGDMVMVNGQSQPVPSGCYYVLGDNSDNSYDSRFWEDPFVREEDVQAKLIGNK